jgi:hypothetical protein
VTVSFKVVYQAAELGIFPKVGLNVLVIDIDLVVPRGRSRVAGVPPVIAV